MASTDYDLKPLKHLEVNHLRHFVAVVENITDTLTYEELRWKAISASKMSRQNSWA